MRLVIVSHTPHYLDGTQIVGWGPTVREIDHLAQLFSCVTHVAPLYREAAPGSSLPYSAGNVHVRCVHPAGGERWLDKLAIMWRAPSYIREIWSEMRQADVVHVRCPANIGLIALLLLTCRRQPRRRWLKYAGNWKPTAPEAWSYTLQRWFLKSGLHGGMVTVNGEWPDQPNHVRAFYNPSLTQTELQVAREVSADKHLESPLRLLFVGRLECAKGVDRALRVVERLVQKGTPVRLDLVGDGPERSRFEGMIDTLGITGHVEIHGWLPRPSLLPFYAAAHLLILPSHSSEGWPKVLSEGMAHGVVPVASNISSIPGYLHRFGCGHALPPDDVDAFVQAIRHYVENPACWQAESKLAAAAAEHFTYAAHLKAVRRLLDLPPGSPGVQNDRREQDWGSEN